MAESYHQIQGYLGICVRNTHRQEPCFSLSPLVTQQTRYEIRDTLVGPRHGWVQQSICRVPPSCSSSLEIPSWKREVSYLVRSIFCWAVYVNTLAQPRVLTRSPHTNSLYSYIVATKPGVHIHSFETSEIGQLFYTQP